MSQGAEPAALPPQPALSPRSEPGTPPRRRRAWLPLIPAVLTLVVTLIQIQGPSFSQDEDATLLAINRTFPQLVRMLGNIDVVHGGYYSLIWVVARLFGTSELAVRFPSAVAMAVAAGGVTLLGQYLVGERAGLAAGLVFTVLPSVSWFAEDARDYAVVTALAVATSYILARALAATARRGWLIAYGIALVLLGLGNLFALLIVPAHAVTIASRARRDRGTGTGRGFVAGWLVAVAAAFVVLSPVAVTAYSQLHQVSWIKPLRLRDVLSVMRVAGTRPLFGVVVAIVLIAVIVAAVAGRDRLRERWPEPLVALALPWLALPPAVLLIGSAIHPLYSYRYIAFCIPALALLAGTALAALGRVAGAAGLIVILLVGLPLQISQRRSDGHGFDIRRVDQIVAQHEQRGDAVLSPSGGAGVYERVFEIAYPYGLRPLRDISRGESPAQSGTIGGTYASQQVERRRLAAVSRLWALGGPQQDALFLQEQGFTMVRRWHISGVWIRLYVRTHTAPGSGQVPAGR